LRNWEDLPLLLSVQDLRALLQSRDAAYAVAHRLGV